MDSDLPTRRTLLGRRVRAARALQGWTQEELGTRAGFDRTYVGAIERGERNVSFDNLVRLAAALETPLATLLDDV